jgi:hypothetical protein
MQVFDSMLDQPCPAWFAPADWPEMLEISRSMSAQCGRLLKMDEEAVTASFRKFEQSNREQSAEARRLIDQLDVDYPRHGPQS